MGSIAGAIALAIVLFFLSSGTAPGAEVSILPSIGIRGEYDDNINFTHTNEQDDFLAVLTPAFSLQYETERTRLESAVALGILRYDDHSELDTENQLYDINLDYQAAERLTLTGAFSYTKDTTLESELQETGLVTVRSDRTRINGTGGVTFQLSELSEVSALYTRTDTEYDFPGNVDYDTDLVVFAYNRRLGNMRDVFTIQPYYQNTTSETSEVDNYGLSLGIAHPFSETLTLSAFAGVRRTRSEFFRTNFRLISISPPRVAFTSVQAKETSWGGVADISLRQTGETRTATIGYNRDLSFNSFGEPIERDRFYATISQRLTERLVAGIYGNLYFTESESDFDTEDSRYFDVGPSLTYRITKDLFLSAHYAYANVDDKTRRVDPEADRNRAWILLQSQFPKSWSF